MKNIEDKAFQAFIDNDALCQHTINELNAAGYFRTNDSYYRNMANRIIKSVAMYSLQSRTCVDEREIELIKMLSLGEYITPLTLKNDEFSSIIKDGSFVNKRCNHIKLDKNSRIFNEKAFDVVYRHIYYYKSGIWNDGKKFVIGHATKLIEIDANNICTGRILNRCYLKDNEIKHHSYFPKRPINISVIATKYSDDIVYYVKLGETGLDVIDNIYDILWTNSATIKDKMLTKLDYSTITRAFKTIQNKINK